MNGKPGPEKTNEFQASRPGFPRVIGFLQSLGKRALGHSGPSPAASLAKAENELRAAKERLGVAQGQRDSAEQELLGRLADQALLEVGTAREELRGAVAAAWSPRAAQPTTAVQLDAEAVALVRRCIHRLPGEGHLETLPNRVSVPRDVLAKMVQDDELQLALTGESGAQIRLEPEKGAVFVGGEDPRGREIARRALRRVAKRGATNARTARRMVRECAAEVDGEIRNSAKRATKRLGTADLPEDMARLLGTLKFRLSYSQNQWLHAVEVAETARLLAAELGLDQGVAARAGLLHDIGKALTHDHEGGHAVLGATEARKAGEDPRVANAIGAHHGEEVMESPYAPIAATADALSGARPGARREAHGDFQRRVHLLAKLAGEEPGVAQVEVLSGGREVRAIVSGDTRGDTGEIAGLPSIRENPSAPIPDSELHGIAQRIAQRISEELVFPGQIRVTVVKETHSIGHAKF